MFFQPLAQSPDLDRRAVAIVKPAGESARALAADYRRAMERQWSDAPLSRRKSPEYTRLRQTRRTDLEAILRTGVASENREKALDLICAICEESSWAGTIDGAFEDPMHPVIDIFAAETACLLGWAVRSGGFDARVCARIRHEIRSRFTTPIMAHDDYPCLSGNGFGHLAIMCDAMAVHLLAETDNARIFTFLRRFSRMTDRLTAGYSIRTLNACLTDWTAAAALWQILRAMTGPQAGSKRVPLEDWMDMLLMAHLGNGIMADPMGEGVHPNANGADIYYIGKCGGDRALRALGANLFRRENQVLSSINARMTSDVATEIESGIDSIMWLRHGASPRGEIMMARAKNTHVMMYGCGNAGGIYVSQGGMAVLVPASGMAPKINSQGQTPHNASCDWEFSENRSDMFCDMTKCYPEAAGVNFFNRTLMLDRTSGSVRMIDLIEANRPGTVEYFLPVAGMAAACESGAKTATCRILWDPAQAYSTFRIDVAGFARTDAVRLEYPLAVGRNIINFYFEET